LEEYAKTRSFLKGLGVNDTELPGYYVCNNRAGGLAEGELVDQQFYASLGKTILPAEDIICLMPFRYQTILWNGDFDLCCADFEGKTVLGNVLTHSFSEIDAAKEKLLENRPLAPICTTCTTPFALGQGKGFLQRKK
jgi:hypothetical protein